MNCPYCNNEMEKRYLESSEGIFLNDQKMYPYPPGTYKNAFRLYKDKLLSLSKACCIDAYYCRDCQKVIFDIPEEVREK